MLDVAPMVNVASSAFLSGGDAQTMYCPDGVDVAVGVFVLVGVNVGV
jgi:hypothetical protein